MNSYEGVAAIILAAGKGTRMKSDMAKVLHKVDSKSMVVHVAECARKIVGDQVHVVIGHQADQVKQEINAYFKVDFAIQKALLGTGDAVKTALPGLKSHIRHILVLCGDVPLIRENTLKHLLAGHINSRAMVTVLATDVEDPTGYGRILLDKDGNMTAIREEADASEIEKQVKKVNTGIYCFDRTFLESAITALKPDNKQAEYYLTDVVEIAQQQKQKIEVVTMDDPRQVIGVNTLEELSRAESLIHSIGQ